MYVVMLQVTNIHVNHQHSIIEREGENKNVQ